MVSISKNPTLPEAMLLALGISAALWIALALIIYKLHG